MTIGLISLVKSIESGMTYNFPIILSGINVELIMMRWEAEIDNPYKLMLSRLDFQRKCLFL